MTRRRFAFWIAFGLFSLAQRLRVYGLDELAAALMQATEPPSESKRPIHWRAADNELWRWFERETYLNGRWQLSGITTPINKETGEAYAGEQGYLDESLVPAEVRDGRAKQSTELPPEVVADFARREPTEKRRQRHGRPPSKWLRSLHAEELRIWLKTIDVPEAGVSGMTFWEHLTRDHFFDAAKIEGLSEEEQAKLHAAAHFGY
jgi:hypothetical protein